MTANPKQLALQIIEDLWNQKTPALIDTLYAANCTIHTPDGVLHGPSGATQLYTAYTTAFPDTHYTVEDVVAEGERVVIRFTFAGTHRGDLRGIAATDRSVAVAGMVLFRFANGQVIEQRGVWDSLSAMQQLGVVQVSGKHTVVSRATLPEEGGSGPGGAVPGRDSFGRVRQHTQAYPGVRPATSGEGGHVSRPRVRNARTSRIPGGTTPNPSETLRSGQPSDHRSPMVSVQV